MNLMNFSKHQKQHFKQHKRKRAHGFCAAADKKVERQNKFKRFDSIWKLLDPFETVRLRPARQGEGLDRRGAASALPLVLWSMYSSKILTICTRVRIKAPNAKEPTWNLKIKNKR